MSDRLAHEMQDDAARLRITSALAGPHSCCECLEDDVPLCSQHRCQPCHEIIRSCWAAHREEKRAGTFRPRTKETA